MSISKKLSVLLIEDEKHTRDLMKDYINDHPQLDLIDVAEDGKQALELINVRRYDILILDIGLPNLSGIELAKKLEHSQSFFIFTTAMKDHAIDAFDIGAVDYLVKPVSKQKFERAIDRAVQIYTLKNYKKNSGKEEKKKVSISEILQREYKLTQQQASIASYFKEGYTRNEICQIFDISPGTLKNHLLTIYKKTLINDDKDNVHREGRTDKLSQLILFLYKLES